MAGERRTSRASEESELVAASQNLAEELGRLPAQGEIQEFGSFSRRDPWADAPESAGLGPNDRNNVSRVGPVEELRRVAEVVGCTPREGGTGGARRRSKHRFTIVNIQFIVLFTPTPAETTNRTT